MYPAHRPPTFPAGNKKFFFLHLWVYFCFVNKFMCAIILDSTYKWYPMIFVFLWHHSGWQSLGCELWCWRRLLRAPWTARSSNQSILKEISPEYSLEGLMLKLKLQYFGHLMQRTNLVERPWCWEWLKAGGEGGNRGWDGWMESPTQWAWVWASSGSWW